MLAILRGCVCLNRRKIQVSQTRRWVLPNDFTDGDRTAPKLDMGEKTLPAGRRNILPSHDTTMMQSVSYHDRSFTRERTRMDLEDSNGAE